MIGAEEKRKLMERVGNDGANGVRAVLKCVAGLVVLVVIAAGPWTFLSMGRHTASQERLAAKAAAEREKNKAAPDDGRQDGEIRRDSDKAEKKGTNAQQAETE